MLQRLTVNSFEYFTVVLYLIPFFKQLYGALNGKRVNYEYDLRGQLLAVM